MKPEANLPPGNVYNQWWTTKELRRLAEAQPKGWTPLRELPEKK